MENQQEIQKTLILSTSWYVFKSKFSKEIYEGWIQNMLSNVNNYKLVVYTDENSESFINPYLTNSNIIKIIKPEQEFYTYRYKTEWIENHKKNDLLNESIDWKVNMLWNEKVHFVYETIQKGYHVKEKEEKEKEEKIYGWCDIGYFRCRNCEYKDDYISGYKDIEENEIKNWPNKSKLTDINPNKIYYARVNNDPQYINTLFTMANLKVKGGLPMFDIPPRQNSIAGGFFLVHESKIEWLRNLYDNTLKMYFSHNKLVKDDQIILVDAIFSNMNKFHLIQTNHPMHDKWFQFQRFLL
jgi:hypothetical protein